MSVLLTNIDLPPKDCSYCIEIYGDGVWAAIEETCYHGKAVEVKAPHGRLIDAEDFLKRLDEYSENVYGCKTDADSVVIAQCRNGLTETEKSILEGLYESREIMEDRVDTIIETEGGGEDG